MKRMRSWPKKDENKDERPRKKRRGKGKAKQKQDEKVQNQEVKRDRNYLEYWSKTDGFEVEHLKGEILEGPFNSIMRPLLVFKNDPTNYRMPLVTLYAKLGLHWYNVLQGTNLQFLRIEKYNNSRTLRPSRFFITLDAVDPATGSPLAMQTLVTEQHYATLRVKCDMTRLKSQGIKMFCFGDNQKKQIEFNRAKGPEWPSQVDPFNDDTGRFYVLKESDLKENDWIRLYFDLAIVASNRSIKLLDLSNISIVQVAVETKDPVNPPADRLKGTRDLTFYITYDQDFGEGSFSRYRLVVRRDVDLELGRCHLKRDQVRVCDRRRLECGCK